MPRSLAGTRIRQRRRVAGVTQTALARQAGISPSYLNLIEHNLRAVAGRVQPLPPWPQSSLLRAAR